MNFLKMPFSFSPTAENSGEIKSINAGRDGKLMMSEFFNCDGKMAVTTHQA